MPRHYPPEVRREACERMLAGEAIKDLAGEASRISPTSSESPWRPSIAGAAKR